MPNDENAEGELIIQPTDTELARARETVDLYQREKTIEVVTDVFKLAIRAGDVALKNADENAALARERERHALALASLDAETQATVDKIKASLGKVKEKTTRLGMLCDLVAKKGRDMPDAVAEGIGKAIASCAEDV